MGRGIDGEAVNQLLHGEIQGLLEVVRMLLLYYSNEPAGAGGLCSPVAGGKFDDIGTLRDREVSDGLVGVQCKDSERLVPAAEQECAMVL
jgi:hypothetical protein